MARHQKRTFTNTAASARGRRRAASRQRQRTQPTIGEPSSAHHEPKETFPVRGPEGPLDKVEDIVSKMVLEGISGDSLGHAMDLLAAAEHESSDSYQWDELALVIVKRIYDDFSRGSAPENFLERSRLLATRIVERLNGRESCDPEFYAEAANAAAEILYTLTFLSLISADAVEEELQSSSVGATSTEITKAATQVRRKWSFAALRYLEDASNRLEPSNPTRLQLTATMAGHVGELVAQGDLGLEDLKTAIDCERDALKVINSRNPFWPGKAVHLTNLAHLLSTGVRVELLNPDALVESVKLARLALAKAKPHETIWVGRLTRLCYALSFKAAHDPSSRQAVAEELVQLCTAFIAALLSAKKLNQHFNATSYVDYVLEWSIPVIAQQLGSREALSQIAKLTALDKSNEELIETTDVAVGRIAGRLSTNEAILYLFGGEILVRGILVDWMGGVRSLEFGQLTGSAVTSLRSRLNAKLWNGAKDEAQIAPALEDLWNAFSIPVLDLLESEYSSESAITELRLRPLGVLASIPFLSTRSAEFEYFSDHVATINEMNIDGQTATPSTNNRVTHLSTLDTDLLYVEADLKAIRARFSDSTEIKAESPSDFVRGLAESETVILSGHGVYNYHYGTAIETPNGSLTAAQISYEVTKRRRELAFINACESALFGQRNPLDVVGLPSALLEVGFTSIVGTQWTVGDLAAHLVLSAVLEQVAEAPKVSMSIHLQSAQRFLRTSTVEDLIAWIHSCDYVPADQLDRIEDQLRSGGTFPLLRSLDIASFTCFGPRYSPTNAV